MKSLFLAIALLVGLTATANATNTSNLFGDTNTTNNNQVYNQPTASGGAGGNGGNAIANGGYGYGGSANVGDIRNTNSATGGSVLGSGNSTSSNINTALGGQGGTGIGVGVGGSAAQHQGQQQGQGQQQSNVGINGQQQSNSNAVDASSQNANDNRSTASGNTTNVGPTTVGGQQASNATNVSTSYVSQRNAPPVYLGNVAATVSCAGGFQAGGSQSGGSGALGFTWISPDCKQVVAGQNMQSLGMVDVACRIFKATDGYKRAVKRDPALADVDCTAK